ncbi:hypothetical protein E8E13_006350 [Curvularia kusanoi]|uniref:C2H2-type domain-containing protein n=1 Tax=Curvularia kusanoi TaxID=90978 RepID=A0A9P4T836_CURKU|nr:hypothetical protein E8E13_006350 [Curvularia kusanoi]
MANHIPQNSSAIDERSDLLATLSTTLHQDIDYAFCSRANILRGPGLGVLNPADLGNYDPTSRPQLQQCVQQEAGLGTLEHSFLPIVSNPPQQVPNVRCAHPDLAPFPEIFEPIGHAEAVIMELPDGRFYCSALGCLAIYLRAGDCRRHLKKHNGPFFPCTQPGCNMEFYRADKLRSHLKQGHNLVVAAPRRGRQTANRSTARPTGINRPGGYQ